MVLPLIPIAISVIGFIPNVYYGLTKGDWLLGWDYALTGKDYLGEFIDGIWPDDDLVDDEGWNSGLTDGDYTFLTDMFGNLEQLITMGIVIFLVTFIVFVLFRKVQ